MNNGEGGGGLQNGRGWKSCLPLQKERRGGVLAFVGGWHKRF